MFEQLRGLPPVVAGHLLHLETVKCDAVVCPLVENGLPAQTRLRAFQNEELKEHAVVVDWYAPFLIVIANHQFAARPGTADKRGIGVMVRSHGMKSRHLSRKALSS